MTKMTIELVDQDYQYCLDFVNGKTNIMGLANVSRIIKAVADGMPDVVQQKIDDLSSLGENT